MALLDNLFTIREAAELLHLSDSRLRQICIESGLGTKAGGVRFLNSSDIDKVRDEVVEARRFFTARGWPVIDVARRSIEETSAAIIAMVQERREKASKRL